MESSKLSPFTGTILILDPDPAEAVLLEFCLRQAGAAGPIQLADSCQRASLALESAPNRTEPRVLLCNFRGRGPETETVSRMRQSAGFRDLFIAVLTETTNAYVESRLFQAGANLVLTKPTSIPELAAVLYCAQTAELGSTPEISPAPALSAPGSLDYAGVVALGGSV